MLRVTKPVFLKENFLSQKCPSNGFFGLIEKFGGYLLYSCTNHISHIWAKMLLANHIPEYFIQL